MKLNKPLMRQTALETVWSLLFSLTLSTSGIDALQVRKAAINKVWNYSVLPPFWPHFYSFKNWQWGESNGDGKERGTYDVYGQSWWKIRNIPRRGEREFEGWMSSISQTNEVSDVKRSTICGFVDCRAEILKYYVNSARNCTESVRIKKEISLMV